jgi:hypothetical protein
MSHKLDYLTEDTFTPKDQKFVCLSFLSDKENKTTMLGIKIRGVFSTYDLACEHAKMYQDIDPSFHIYVGEMGKWLPFDPVPDSEAVKSSEYANEQLNSLMKGYLENQEKAKVFHEQRKTEMIKQNILDNLGTMQSEFDSIKKKIKKSNNSDDKLDLQKKMENVEEKIKKLEEKKKELDGQLEKISTDLKVFDKPNDPPKIVDYDNIKY